ncbi:MAG: hypothetical protein U0Q12_25255 [Vicinamibacterales bacterium]
MNRLIVRACLLTSCSVAAVPCAAQSSSAPATTLTAGVGVSLDDSAAGAAVGAGLELGVTSVVAIEGSGRWLNRGDVSRGFAADAVMHVGLPLTEVVAPYGLVGVGLYRAAIDVPAGGIGPSSDVPDYFVRRIVAGPLGNAARHVTFTDPTFVVGGGVMFVPSRAVVVQPDVRLLVLRRDGRSHAMVVATVSIGFRMERRSHPSMTGAERRSVGVAPHEARE